MSWSVKKVQTMTTCKTETKVVLPTETFKSAWSREKGHVIDLPFLHKQKLTEKHSFNQT